MNKSFFRKNIASDLGVQILALYALFIIPIVIFALFFDNISGQRLEAEIKSSDLALAQAIAKETETSLSTSLYTVEQLSLQTGVIAAENNSMRRIFEQLYQLRSDINLIYRLDSDGIMVFHYPEGPGSTLGIDFSFREYFQRALTTRNPIVSLGRISPTTKQPVATAIMPIWQAGQFLGVVGTNLTLQSLSNTLASISAEYGPDEQFQIFILDAAGKVIANPSPDVLLTDFSEIAPGVAGALLSGEGGNRIEINTFGEETLFSFVPVPSASWGVVISRPAEVAFATPRNFHNGVLLMVAVFLGIGFFFWLALSIRVIRPVDRLAEYSRMLGGNQSFDEYTAKSLQEFANRSDQIGHLIRSFKRMEAAINARIDELGTLLETSAAVVSTLDSQAVLERILEQVERLLDIKQSIIVALDQDKGVFIARASRGMSARYAQSLVISPDEVSSVTMRAIRIGEPIQVSDTETDPSFAVLRPRARAEGYRSMVAIPLKTTHAPPAALNVYSPEPKTYSDRELDLLSTFAHQATMAIENAELYARSDTRLQEQTRRLEALIQSLEVGLILEDLDGRILYANRMVTDLSNIPSEKLMGHSVKVFYQSLLKFAVNIGEAQEKVHQFLSGDYKEEYILSLEYLEKPRYIRLKGFTVSDAAGVGIGHGQILQDITRDYELDQMKSSLVSTVSHELRTPLASIKGYASSLLADDIVWELSTQQEFLSIISRDADRLADMVDNLLDISRIESDNLQLSKSACSLENIIIHGVERVDLRASQHISLDIPGDLPPVYVDAYRIEVVIRNLVENAVKYAGASDPIHIHAVQDRQDVVVRVEDQGPGIPPDRIDHIFDSFFRLDTGLARRKPGVGLGLAICRGFIKAHGGEIWVESRQRGACFAFTIPLVDPEIVEGLLRE